MQAATVIRNARKVAGLSQTQLTLCITEPAPTGSKRWDAALAGLVAYRLRQQGVLAPSWVNTPSRFLGKVWNISEGTYPFVVNVNDVPQEFLERGTLVAAPAIRFALSASVSPSATAGCPPRRDLQGGHTDYSSGATEARF